MRDEGPGPSKLWGISKQTLPFPKGAFTRSKGDNNDRKWGFEIIFEKSIGAGQGRL
jgi:hypothetical protein